MAKVKLSRRQLLTLFIVACVNFFCSVCVSLQAPFYPAEVSNFFVLFASPLPSFFKPSYAFCFQAEKKGATATEYGLVFGSFELVGFLTSPLFGKIVNNYFLLENLI